MELERDLPNVAFWKRKKENASSIGTALYFVFVGPTKENASSIGTALYYVLAAQSTAAALSPSRKDAWASSPRLGKELWDADRKPP